MDQKRYCNTNIEWDNEGIVCGKWDIINCFMFYQIDLNNGRKPGKNSFGITHCGTTCTYNKEINLCSLEQWLKRFLLCKKKKKKKLVGTILMAPNLYMKQEFSKVDKLESAHLRLS